MKKFVISLILAAICALSVFSQTNTPAPKWYGNYPFVSQPTTCSSTIGSLYYDTTNKVFKFCSATNTWSAFSSGSSGANTALSNLASVSINSSLIPQTGIDLGAAATPWRNLYLYGAGTFGTTSLKLTGTPTANRVLNFPDVNDTVAVLGTAQTFTAAQTISTTTGGNGNQFIISDTTGANTGLQIVSNQGTSTIRSFTSGLFISPVSSVLQLNGAFNQVSIPANTPAYSSSGYSLNSTNAQSLVDLSGTWNGTGTPTAFKLNITDTASNASSVLMDLQVGGSSKFKVDKSGNISNLFSTTFSQIFQASSYFRFANAALILPISANGIVIKDSSNADFSGLFAFGGTTSSFPALKRSTNTLLVRVADDSAYANINAQAFVDGTSATAMGSGGLFTKSAGAIAWSSTSLYSGTPDTGLSRSSAGIVKVTDGSSGSGTIWAAKFCYDSGQTICDFAGTGSPQSVVTASIGSTYRRTDGSTSTTFYVKESGTSTNTGWVAK